MKLNDTGKMKCDVLVIGGGGAGVRAAIEARLAGADVLLVSKARIGYANNTYIAKAVIAASGWGDPRDGGGAHLEDTLEGGRLLNDRELVSLMVEEAKGEISFLEKCGVAFAKKEGRLHTEQIAGHRFPRHVRGEHRTGSDLMVPLKQYAEKVGVRFLDRVFITRLFASNTRILGAFGVSHDGRFVIFRARSVVLATGGFAQMYLHTNNAAGITGDGQSLALDLGLSLKDMEFVQFYPTATGRLGNRLILSEVLVMAEGAVLKNSAGEDIALKHGLNEPMQMTRDRLAQAIMAELMAGGGVDGGVIMDLSPIPEKRLPSLASLLPSTWQPHDKTLVVSPTTHFCMGGIMIDKNSETPLPGLFAAGEVTAGVHGANRLGGNALCEVFTFGGIAGRNAAARAKEMGFGDLTGKMTDSEKARLESRFKGKGENCKDLTRSLKEIMWVKVGIRRDATGLEKAHEEILGLEKKAAEASIEKTSDLIRCLELENMLKLSRVVCQAALLRDESRGSHYRTDCPKEDNERWLQNIVVKKEKGVLIYRKTGL